MSLKRDVISPRRGTSFYFDDGRFENKKKKSPRTNCRANYTLRRAHACLPYVCSKLTENLSYFFFTPTRVDDGFNDAFRLVLSTRRRRGSFTYARADTSDRNDRKTHTHKQEIVVIISFFFLSLSLAVRFISFSIHKKKKKNYIFFLRVNTIIIIRFRYVGDDDYCYYPRGGALFDFAVGVVGAL